MTVTTLLDSSILVTATMTRRGTRWAHTNAIMTLNALGKGRALITIGARAYHGVTFQMVIAATWMSSPTRVDPTDATMTQIAKVIEPARVTNGAKATITATVKASRIGSQRLSRRLSHSLKDAMSMSPHTTMALIGAMETGIAKVIEPALIGDGAREETTATEIISYDSKVPSVGQLKIKASKRRQSEKHCRIKRCLTYFTAIKKLNGPEN